jgi:6-phosphofructokinase 2
METIVTLTLNPAIDGSSEAEAVRHTNKVRTFHERYDPGGGGINVARVIGELGADALAVCLAGGATGDLLDALLDARGVNYRRIPIQGDTRINHVVFERSSGREYRFVAEGPDLQEDEAEACLDALRGIDCAYLVVSGSLPRGIPDDFYARVADIAAGNGAKLVLDTSGPALKTTLDHGGVHLVKPSLGEFELLVGRKLDDFEAVGEAARELVGRGCAEMIAVTLGRDGAVLASRDGVFHREVPDVEVKSAVGAGDSFVGGMTFGLATGLSRQDAFLFGMAAGTAAVLTPGTELCRKADVERLFKDLKRT